MIRCVHEVEQRRKERAIEKQRTKRQEQKQYSERRRTRMGQWLCYEHNQQDETRSVTMEPNGDNGPGLQGADGKS